MKFRFLGGGDCPDWLLASLYELSSFNEDNIASLCEYLAKNKQGESLDEKVLLDMLRESESNSVPPISTVKVLVSCIHYVLYAAQRLNVPGDVLVGELQQLGLPRSHAVHLRKAADLRAVNSNSESGLRISRLLHVTANEPSDNRVIDCIELNMNIQNGSAKSSQTHLLLLQKHDLPDLINELKRVRDRMDEIQL